MKQSLRKKEQTIKKTNDLFATSLLTTIVEYKCVKSLEMKLIRQELFKNDIQLKIIKNTLAKRAILNTLNKTLIDNITGQIIIIFSKKEICLPLTILQKFIKNNINLKIKALCLYGKFFSNEEINKIINLPTKKQALLTLITLLRSPLITIILTFKTPCLNLITLLTYKLKKI